MMNKIIICFLSVLLVIVAVILILIFNLKIDNFLRFGKIIKILVCSEFIMYINLLYMVNKIVRNRQKKTNNRENKKITERQFLCLRNLMYENETYKSLAASLCVSESTIKKDMTDLYELFNVSTKNELKKKISNMSEKNKYLLLEEKVICEL